MAGTLRQCRSVIAWPPQFRRQMAPMGGRQPETALNLALLGFLLVVLFTFFLQRLRWLLLRRFFRVLSLSHNLPFDTHCQLVSLVGPLPSGDAEASGVAATHVVSTKPAHRDSPIERRYYIACAHGRMPQHALPSVRFIEDSHNAGETARPFRRLCIRNDRVPASFTLRGSPSWQPYSSAYPPPTFPQARAERARITQVQRTAHAQACSYCKLSRQPPHGACSPLSTCAIVAPDWRVDDRQTT
jgi:hypothetical protein